MQEARGYPFRFGDVLVPVEACAGKTCQVICPDSQVAGDVPISFSPVGRFEDPVVGYTSFRYFEYKSFTAMREWTDSFISQLWGITATIMLLTRSCWDWGKQRLMQKRAEKHHDLGLPPPQHLPACEVLQECLSCVKRRRRDFVEGRKDFVDCPKHFLRDFAKVTQLPPDVSELIMVGPPVYVWFARMMSVSHLFQGPLSPQARIYQKYGIIMRPKDHMVDIDIFAVFSVLDFQNFLAEIWTLLEDMSADPRKAHFFVATPLAMMQWLPALQDWKPEHGSATREDTVIQGSSRLVGLDGSDGGVTLTIIDDFEPDLSLPNSSSSSSTRCSSSPPVIVTGTPLR